jgi:hypothetical protein
LRFHTAELQSVLKVGALKIQMPDSYFAGAKSFSCDFHNKADYSIGRAVRNQVQTEAKRDIRIQKSSWADTGLA